MQVRSLYAMSGQDFVTFRFCPFRNVNFSEAHRKAAFYTVLEVRRARGNDKTAAKLVQFITDTLDDPCPVGFRPLVDTIDDDDEPRTICCRAAPPLPQPSAPALPGGCGDPIPGLFDEFGDKEINDIVLPGLLGEIVRAHKDHQWLMRQGKPALCDDPGFSVTLAAEDANYRLVRGGSEIGVQFIGQSLAMSDICRIRVTG